MKGEETTFSADCKARPVDHRQSEGAVQEHVRVNGTAAEQRLVMRCLAGEERAWEQLYRKCHPELLETIKFLQGGEANDAHLVEEIAARVWFELLRDRARLLARYEPDRDSTLNAFLMGLARIEMMRHRRAERRRRLHERTAGHKSEEQQAPSDWQVRSIIEEFMSTLTPREKEFMDDYLTSRVPSEESGNGDAFSTSNAWQQRHRIRTKLQAFLKEAR